MADENLMTVEKQLEAYSDRHRDEVLLVHATIDGEADTIMIFRGFSSSLSRATAYDPDVPVLPESATIQTIDRVKSPYIPEFPQFIERDIPGDRFIAQLQ
ncbi:MAG: hypothetical protein ACFCA4_01125 [Cyanophyceae cyanobacterium]